MPKKHTYDLVSVCSGITAANGTISVFAYLRGAVLVTTSAIVVLAAFLSLAGRALAQTYAQAYLADQTGGVHITPLGLKVCTRKYGVTFYRADNCPITWPMPKELARELSLAILEHCV